MERLAAPKMEPKVREYLTHLRQDAFLEIKEGYVDTGASPGKDTTWKDVAQLKPQTTTKEEVAARKKHRFLGVIPHGGADKPDAAAPAASPAKPDAAAPTTSPAKQ
jgi:hypothetical protein